MKQKIRHILLPAAMLLGLGYLAFFLPLGKAFRLYDRKALQEVFAVPVKAGDQLNLEIEHSFEHIPWFEYYTITEEGQFNLDAVAVAGYGAGIPAEMDVPTRIEDGMVWMEGINSLFPRFSWITSATYMKTLTLNGKAVFDFRSLPDASKITGEVVNIQGGIRLCQIMRNKP